MDDVAQGDSVDVLHHNVGLRTGGRRGLPGVVHGHDRGMVERRGVLGLASETQIETRIAGQIRAQHLDRDIAVQPQIPGQMDFRHSAEAEDLPQLVAVGDVLAGHGGGPPSGASGSGASGSTVSVTVCWIGVWVRSFRSATTSRIALMIARAPSTPAAQSRAR